MTLTPLGDALQNKFNRQRPLNSQIEAALIVEYTEAILLEVLGPIQGKLAKPLFLKNKTLTITCSNSAVAQEIRLHQGDIVSRVNQKLGGKHVDRIRYLA